MPWTGTAGRTTQGTWGNTGVRQRSRTGGARTVRRAVRAPAGRAARPAHRSCGSLDLTVGLDDQLHTAHVALGAQDTHPGHAEHHRCRRAALTTVHVVEAFRSVAWSLLILEGLGPSRRQPAATGAPPPPRSEPKSPVHPDWVGTKSDNTILAPALAQMPRAVPVMPAAKRPVMLKLDRPS